MLPQNLAYYQSMREDVLEMIPDNVKKVLSVGCGAGVTESRMKSELAIPYVVGVEINEKVASLAKEVLDEVIIGDAENVALPFPDGYFDLLVCADVLEHFKDPWSALKTYATYLKQNGYIIVSLPNVRFYYVIWRLICGRWEYQNRGILDRSHLRFFTFQEIRRMLHDTGCDIVRIKRNFRLLESMCKYRTFAKLLSLFIFRDFFTFQYVILAKKTDRSPVPLKMDNSC